LKKQLENYYQNNLSKHGSNAQGVGWKNEEAQRIRFDQLLKVIHSQNGFSINDVGCGVGDFSAYLKGKFSDTKYFGYDLMPQMIEKAKEKYSEDESVRFYEVGLLSEMKLADYSVASGIFNLKFDQAESQWNEYIIETISILNDKSIMGFSFNSLTKYSDKEFMKPELYYTDPLWLFDYCKINFAKNVALLHDYGQYDFTILVKKEF
jgi:SAM-dependent methyltransferase